MSGEWLYLMGVTGGLGIFAAVLFYMSIHAPGPKR